MARYPKLYKVDRGEPLHVRFHEMYTPEPNSGCWLWIGGVAANNYGRINVGKKYLSSHRVSYELHYGPVPNGLFVCHKCDNRGCVNPAHLYAGTPQDNMTDLKERGCRTWATHPEGWRVGEKNPRAKLTKDQVSEIKASVLIGRKDIVDCAAQYGVSEGTIYDIRAGRKWAHVEARAALAGDKHD